MGLGFLFKKKLWSPEGTGEDSSYCQFAQAYTTLTFLTLWSCSSRWAKAAVTIDFIYAGRAKCTGRRLTLVYI